MNFTGGIPVDLNKFDVEAVTKAVDSFKDDFLELNKIWEKFFAERGKDTPKGLSAERMQFTKEAAAIGRRNPMALLAHILYTAAHTKELGGAPLN